MTKRKGRERGECREMGDGEGRFRRRVQRPPIPPARPPSALHSPPLYWSPADIPIFQINLQQATDRDHDQQMCSRRAASLA